MQRLLPEVPCFKTTHPVFVKESKKQAVADVKQGQKEEESHFHHLHKAPLSISPQPDLTRKSPREEISKVYGSRLHQHCMTDRETANAELPPPTTSSSEASVLHGDPTIVDGGHHKPLLVPLTMDITMNNFPVRVSFSFYTCTCSQGIQYHHTSLQESKRKSAMWTNYVTTKGCS